MRITISLIMLIAFISYAIESDQNTVPETGTIIGRVAEAYINEVYGVDNKIANATVMV